MNWSPPVLIYQMGKVGSESIQASFDALGLPNIHAHFLSWQSLNDVENYYLKRPQEKIPEHVHRSKKLRAIIDETRGRIRWKVITLVREPVARTISAIFQNLTSSMPHINSLDESDASKQILAYALEQFDNFNEKSDYICTWFDKEIKDVFNFDVYALEFSKKNGYQIFEAGNADILLIKLEKLAECHQRAFQDFLDIQRFPLIQANVGDQKPYRRLYKNVLDSISIPQLSLERVYSSRYTQHFYAREEIQHFRRRWSSQPADGRSAGSNEGVSKISPTGLSPVKNMNQNGLFNTKQTSRLNQQTFTSSTRAGSCPYLPTISLVTPSYNQGKYLAECIDSVLSQNYPNLEYVIMDGGSTDNSVEIIKKHEKYLTYWQSQPDGGQFAAVNDGFRKTRGEIMTWLNSDDKFHPNAFFAVAAIFMLRNEIEWITGRLNTLDEQGSQFWIAESLTSWARSKYLNKDFMDPWIQQEGTFWRRCLWERSGSKLRVDLDFAGDLELWTRFFRSAQLYSADTLLAGYRSQPESKAYLHMDKYLQEATDVLDEECRLFQAGVHKEMLPSPEPVNLDQIRQGLKFIQDLDPAFASITDWQDGWTAFRDGHQATLEFYKASIQSRPNDARIHNSLGMLYWQTGDPQKALAEFTTALRINPHYPHAAVNLVDALTRIKEVGKAERLYSSYLSANPQYKYLFKSLARTAI